jgi:hypothetical protein
VEINYPAWSFWRDMVVIACAFGSAIYTWWSNRKKVTNRRFKEHDDRIVKLETDVKHPNCQYHLGFEGRLDTLHGDIRELAGGVKGLRRAVDLMNEFLINQGGRK